MKYNVVSAVEMLPIGEVMPDPWHVLIPEYHERMCAIGFAAREHMTRACTLTLEKVGPDAHVQAMLDRGWKGNL